MNILYRGNTTQIIEDPEDALFVYKVALPENEAYLDNEEAAIRVLYAALKTRGSREGIIHFSHYKKEAPNGLMGLRLENIRPAGRTIDEFVAEQEELPLDRVERERRIGMISEALQDRNDISEDKLMSRVSILLGILDASDNYIEHLSQNDIRPENVAVYDDGERVKIFDFNRAITHRLEYRKGKSDLTIDHLVPLTSITEIGDDYDDSDGIHKNKRWAHPGMLEGLETILEAGSVTPEQTLKHSELYQATNVLYWMLTGRNLKDSNETVVSKLPILYRPIAVQVDKLIEEVKKPLGSYDEANVVSIRSDLSQRVSSYREEQRRRQPVAVTVPVGLVQSMQTEARRLRAFRTAQPVEPYQPGVHQELVDANAAMQASLDRYVQGAQASADAQIGSLLERITTLEGQVAEANGIATQWQTEAQRQEGLVKRALRTVKRKDGEIETWHDESDEVLRRERGKKTAWASAAMFGIPIALGVGAILGGLGVGLLGFGAGAGTGYVAKDCPEVVSYDDLPEEVISEIARGEEIGCVSEMRIVDQEMSRYDCSILDEDFPQCMDDLKEKADKSASYLRNNLRLSQENQALTDQVASLTEERDGYKADVDTWRRKYNAKPKTECESTTDRLNGLLNEAESERDACLEQQEVYVQQVTEAEDALREKEGERQRLQGLVSRKYTPDRTLVMSAIKCDSLGRIDASNNNFCAFMDTYFLPSVVGDLASEVRRNPQALGLLEVYPARCSKYSTQVDNYLILNSGLQ